jgi:hypothetical protein
MARTKASEMVRRAEMAVPDGHLGWEHVPYETGDNIIVYCVETKKWYPATVDSNSTDDQRLFFTCPNTACYFEDEKFVGYDRFEDQRSYLECLDGVRPSSLSLDGAAIMLVCDGEPIELCRGLCISVYDRKVETFYAAVIVTADVQSGLEVIITKMRIWLCTQTSWNRMARRNWE